MSLFVPSVQRAVDANGNTLSGAKWWFYESGGLDPATVYAEAELETELGSSVTADAGGLFANIYLDDDLDYRAILKTAAGVTIKDIDPYNGSGTTTQVGLFSAAATVPLSATAAVVETTGYNAEGRGKAIYIYDTTVDAPHVVANPRSSFVNANGRGYRLAETIVTPYMFGALGDGITDDTLALQAFFNHAFIQINAARCVYDFSGGIWAVSDTIYIGGEYANPMPELGRRFIAGRIRVLNGATLDALPVRNGSSLQEVVVVIAGMRTSMQGTLYVDGMPYYTSYLGVDYSPPLVTGAPAYADRRFDVGVLLADVNGSSIENIHVDGARRDAVCLLEDAFTFRGGTAYEMSHGGGAVEANNIGLWISTIYARYCGSYQSSTSNRYTTAVSASTHGSTDNATPVPSFTAGSGAGGSNAQRSQVTVDSTAEFSQYDIGYRWMEVPAATYTSISADATAGTFTWTAGDPVAAGFVVGDRIHLEDESGVGANEGVLYEIISFSGGSNRTITVWPKPSTTESNKVYTKMIGPASFHLITYIRSSTQMEVWPWEPARNNSAWYSCHGYALNANGRNTASTTVGLIYTFMCGGGMAATGLYCPHILTFLPEYTNIGVTVGETFSAATIGLVIDHAHFEASAVPLLEVGGMHHTIIKGGSDLSFVGFRKLIGRATTTSAEGVSAQLGKITVDRGGEVISNSGRLKPYEGSGAELAANGTPLTNVPSFNEYALTANSGTVYVGFDEDVGRIFGGMNKARIQWHGPSGAGPSGTLTLTLTAELVHRGWAFAGAGSSTSFALSSPRGCVVLLTYERTAKLVDVVVLASRRVLEGSATYDPGSIASGAQASTTVTVTGAALGDYVEVAPSISPGGLILTGHVTAANTVSVYYANLSGGAIDLASHTIRALVEKR